MSASLIQLAKNRKTTRTFKKAPINLDDVIHCIKVAVQAPSGANRQPWRFIIIDDPEKKECLRESCEEQERLFHQNAEPSLKTWLKSKNLTWRKSFLTEAPVILVIFSNQKDPYATESTWLAIGYILLALEEKSLSTVTYTPPYPENLRRQFSTPKDYRLETILPIGHSAKQSFEKKRRPYHSFIQKNIWNKQA